MAAVIISNNKGTMPIWVAILGSLVVLGTITGTQRIMQGFMASKSDHVIKMKYDSAIDWAINLGAYLVTNNYILCRKTAWSSSNNKCRWNGSAPAPNTHADYSLSNEAVSNGKLSYELSTPDDVDFNLSENIKIKFDLVAWDHSGGELKKVIGDIPGGLCRHKTNKKITKTCHTQTACTQDSDCTSSPNKCVSGVCSCCTAANETFEAISSVDDDYDVVLVEVVAGEGTSNQTKNYVGVRRPLSRLILSFVEDPKCVLKCDVGSVASAPALSTSSSASCRSSLQSDPVTVEVRVFNQGPGALYDLSLLREARMRHKLESCTADADCRTGGGSQKCENSVCVGRKVINLTSDVQTVTGNICTSNSDCTAPQTCDSVRSVCVHACAAHTDCATAAVTVCQSGVCAASCWNNSQCTVPGETCDTVRSICLPDPVPSGNVAAVLPGESFVFEDTIQCENSGGSDSSFPEWNIQTVRETLIDINNTGTALDDQLSQNVNVYSEKIMELEYKLDLITTETGSTSTANIEPKRIFHHGNTIGLLDSISTAFMVYEPPN